MKKHIIVDGMEFMTDKDTIMDALDEIGIEVPRLCKHDDLSPIGSCRLCLVEANGRITTSCNTQIMDNMTIVTNSDKVLKERKQNLKLIFSNHPQECLTCFRNETCELQSLASKYSLAEDFEGKKRKRIIDSSSHSIVRDNGKCILCGRCVEVCKNQGINAINYMNRGFKTNIGTPFNLKISESDCIGCGQCVLYCPTAALTEKDDREVVLKNISKENYFSVVQFAPAIRVSLSNEFDIPNDENVSKKLSRALKLLGFDAVIDTSFAADLTVMEEAHEFIERFLKGEKMFTSCCPGWVNFVETKRKDYLKRLSTCKSPHQMTGAVIKSYYAKEKNIDPSKITVVSIMPCTAKKEEVNRVQQKNDSHINVDFVLTTRELIKILREEGIDLKELENRDMDIFPQTSSAGEIFGKSGGVMEAALRTAKYFLKDTTETIDFKEVRADSEFKKATINILGKTITVGVVNGIGNFIKHEKEIQELDFVEVMACPGGCIGGGGQPQPFLKEDIMKRKQNLTQIDSNATLRESHKNPCIIKLYDDFLKEPGSEIAEKYLHTKYLFRGNL
jgi:iron-only hydrogenase group A